MSSRRREKRASNRLASRNRSTSGTPKDRFLFGFLVNHNGDLSPWFFVSVASKGVSVSVRPLKSTLMSILISVASKALDGGRLRLKTGKTRCLSASAHSKRLKGTAEQGASVAGEISELGDRGRRIGVRLGKEFGDRRGWDWTNTQEDSTP
jgi:hypothetical protein